MPANSKAQFRFMEGVKHGNIKAKGLSEAKAAEFVDHVNYKKLPNKKMAKKNKMKKKIKMSPSKLDMIAKHATMMKTMV